MSTERTREILQQISVLLNSLNESETEPKETKQETDVRNVRSYIITSLYNAPTTMDTYYGLMVNHDLYGQ